MSLRDILKSNPVKGLNSVLSSNLSRPENIENPYNMLTINTDTKKESEKGLNQETPPKLLDKRPRKSVVSDSEDNASDEHEPGEIIQPDTLKGQLNSKPFKKHKDNHKKEVKVVKEVTKEDKQSSNHERRLISISDLTAITPSKNCKKRFKIRVKWSDGSAVHVKHVRFGKHGREEFIDHHDELKRTSRVVNLISRLEKKGRVDDFLQEDYYVVSLLNNLPSIQESYSDLLSKCFKL